MRMLLRGWRSLRAKRAKREKTYLALLALLVLLAFLHHDGDYALGLTPTPGYHLIHRIPHDGE